MKGWMKNIRQVTPYTPGEQPKRPGIIKLNTNENPYPPSPEVDKALKEMDVSMLRRYPDPTCQILNDALAQEYHLRPEQVFTGVGSDDVLAMCFMTFFDGEQPVLFPDITYNFYEVWAEVLRIPYRKVPLDEHFCIQSRDYAVPNGGVIFANPNAPTGQVLDLGTIREILDSNRDSIVIVDEAYIDFGGESALRFLDEYENLVVIQTFSKSRSLAGMRIGAAFASPELIRYLTDVKYSINSYTLNTAALIAGAASARDREYFQETVGKIIRTRERVSARLRSLGFTFEDSAANFLFVTHPEIPAVKLFEALKEEGIYVRYFRQPRIDNYLRITIGTDEEMDALIRFLEGMILL